ncbi:MAG: acyl-CoA thioesterase domain-containing protein [Pseudomonadota bacterium]
MIGLSPVLENTVIAIPWSLLPAANASAMTFVPERASCVGEPGAEFVMGGVAMAAAIDALEQWAKLPLFWGTIQFIGPGRFRQPLKITCEALSTGRSVRQATASLIDNR